MLLDETSSRPDRAAAFEPDPAETLPGDRREAARLRELALWYRVFAERAGNPTIGESRRRMAEELERESDRVLRLDLP